MTPADLDRLESLARAATPWDGWAASDKYDDRHIEHGNQQALEEVSNSRGRA